jgi:hypothetical protein
VKAGPGIDGHEASGQHLGEPAGGQDGGFGLAVERHQPGHPLLGRRMRAQDRRFRHAPARQQDLLPVAPLIALELVQRARQAGRIAGDRRRFQIGVELARPRQRQLQQTADDRRQYQDEQGGKGDSGLTEQPQRQAQRGEEQADRRHQAGEPAQHVGEAHQPQIVVAHMADLVRQHGRELAPVEPAQEAVGDGDDGAIAMAGGKRVERRRWQQIEPRRHRQTSAAAQPLDQGRGVRKAQPIDRLRAVGTHHQFRCQGWREGEADETADHRP